MADRHSKQAFTRVSQGIVALTLAFVVAGCGTTGSRAAAGGALLIGSGQVAPIEGSPEQTAVEIRGAQWHVAPVDGSPEDFLMHSGD